MQGDAFRGRPLYIYLWSFTYTVFPSCTICPFTYMEWLGWFGMSADFYCSICQLIISSYITDFINLQMCRSTAGCPLFTLMVSNVYKIYIIYTNVYVDIMIAINVIYSLVEAHASLTLPLSRIDWGNTRVERSARGYWGQWATEAIRIRSCKNSMNLDSGLHLPATWNPILDQT